MQQRCVLCVYDVQHAKVEGTGKGSMDSKDCTLPPQASRPTQAAMTSAAASSNASSSAQIADIVKQGRRAQWGKQSAQCAQTSSLYHLWWPALWSIWRRHPPAWPKTHRKISSATSEWQARMARAVTCAGVLYTPLQRMLPAPSQPLPSAASLVSCTNEERGELPERCKHSESIKLT